MKKLTKLTALALALALVLGMTAMAADTKVYHVEDFDYDAIANFSGNTVRVALGGSATKSYANGIIAARNNSLNQVFWTTNAGRFDSNGGASLITNSFGSKGVSSYSKEYQAKNTGSGTWMHIPSEAWKLNDHKDETYVISYEVAVNPVLSMDSMSNTAKSGRSTSSYTFANVIWGGELTKAEDETYSWASNPTEMQMVWVDSIRSKITSEETVTETVGEDVAVGDSLKQTVDPTTGAGTAVYTKVEDVTNEEDGTTTRTKTVRTMQMAVPETTRLVGAGEGWNKNNGIFKIISNKVDYRIAYGLRANETNIAEGTDYYWPTRITAVDGEVMYSDSEYPIDTNGSNSTSYNFENGDMVYGINLGPVVNHGYEYANIRMYTIKNDSFKAEADVTGEVATTSKKVRVKFTNPVAPATFSKAVTVKKNGEEMAGGYTVGDLKHYTGDVNGEVYSYVDVEFNELKGNSTYTIEFADTIANELATTLGEKNVATFTTGTAPTFTMTLNAYKGLKETETALEVLEAGTVYFKASATYDKGEVVTNGRIRIEILDSEGNVVKYVTTARDLTSTATFGAAFKVAANQKARAYVENADGEAIVR